MKIAQLIYDPFCDRLSFDGDDLHCGDCLEVLIAANEKPRWVKTRLESNDDGWYMVGLRTYQASGLFARR